MKNTLALVMASINMNLPTMSDIGLAESNRQKPTGFNRLSQKGRRKRARQSRSR